MSKPNEHSPNPKLASSAFTHLVGSFKDRISGMFDQLVDVLLGMAEKSGSVKDQHLYFDSMRTLRQSRGEIIEAFENNLNEMGKNPEALSKPAPSVSVDTLELVSDDTMNENVTLSNLAQRISNRAGDEINALDIRIDSISNDEQVMGITPEIALRALEAALRKADLEFETRQVVYQVIEQQAVHSLANVYAEMNQWLVNQGVMPRIPLGYVRRNAIGRRKDITQPLIMDAENKPETPQLRSFAEEIEQAQTLQDMPPAGGSSLRHFNPDVSDEFESAIADRYTQAQPGFTGYPASPAGGQEFIQGMGQGIGMGSENWLWDGETSEVHIPWLNQQLEKIRSHEKSPIAQALARITPALNQAAVKDLSIMHDRRHPMRRALTLLEDLVIDLDSEDGLNDIGGEITQMIGLMEARAAHGPAFWLHVVKYLNYIKDELHSRLWSDDEGADHQERVRLARRLATRQIQLLMRDKRVTPALQRILSHMLGPALAIMMLRHRHDRDSQVLRNAMQLVHDVIESVQALPDSLESMHYLEHASGKALTQRLQGFFMGFSGFDQASIAEALVELEHEHSLIMGALEARNSQVTLPIFTVQSLPDQHHEHAPHVLHLPALPSPTLVKEFTEDEIETGVIIEPDEPKPIEQVASKVVNEPQNKESSTPPPAAATTTQALPVVSAAVDDTPVQVEADLGALNNLALDALLEKIMRDHRYTWFQVPACEGCTLRRLMFGAYDHARRLVMFCNVRQEPTLTISIVDFDLGLKAGTTRPLYDEPKLGVLLQDYLKSCAASGGT